MNKMLPTNPYDLPMSTVRDEGANFPSYFLINDEEGTK